MPSIRNQFSLRGLQTLCAAVCITQFTPQSAQSADTTILGFSNEAGKAQREVEATYDRNIDAGELLDWLKTLSARPHHAGSDASRENAETIAALFRSWGYEVKIETYGILMPTPRVRVLELIEPTSFKASLEEEALPADASTTLRHEALPAYNVFSPDGEVEGELVFVNYGRPEDHELLERYGIDVKGKIVIARYGLDWRGVKAKLAAEKGAIATILYSDPTEDGYAAGDVYPLGPFKSASGTQRGSVMDLPTHAGDVLTPGVGATKGAKRLKVEDSATIAKIPVLPISYGDAQPLLAALGGEVAPVEWRGGLPITYHLGPGPAKVRLKVKFNWDQATAYNVIARLAGEKYPDEWVIRGNHHDGWTFGASDPLSGQVAMLAEAKSVARLVAAGVRPARTIIYAAWDAEEEGMIGSTEWVEDHAQELQQHAVAYLNTDSNSRGFLGVVGSPTLERFLNQIMEDVTDPLTGVSLKDRRRASMWIAGKEDEERTREDLRLTPPGSGTDYTAFLHHLGIPSAAMEFEGEGLDGSYHTLYDTYEHFTKWRDPGLLYGVALARVAGRATLRMANAQVVPFEFNGFVDNVNQYVNELEILSGEMREKAKTTNRQIAEGAFQAALDPKKSLRGPKPVPSVPFFNFAPLRNALVRLQVAADAHTRAVAANRIPTQKLAEINRLLYTSERLLIRQAGLPRRPWYKHQIYAPGFYTGYSAKTLPGVREAIEERKYDQVEQQIEMAAEVLDGMTQRIVTLTSMWK